MLVLVIMVVATRIEAFLNRQVVRPVAIAREENVSNGFGGQRVHTVVAGRTTSVGRKRSQHVLVGILRSSTATVARQFIERLIDKPRVRDPQARSCQCCRWYLPGR